MDSRRTGLGTGAMTAIKEEIVAAAEIAMEVRFKDLFFATLAEQQQLARLMIPVSQEVVMPPPVLGQASSACAQSSVASTTAQQYPVDTIMTITSCLLLYPVGRVGKTKEVAKA